MSTIRCLKRFKLNSLLALLIAVFALCCKSSSKLSESESRDSATVDIAVNTEIDSLPPETMEDMMKVSSTIRHDLETYFADFSTLDIKNEKIREVYLQRGMEHFDSPETPVLIIVSQANGQLIYDKPTSIEKYLDYLKYKQQNPHTLHNFHLNDEGKIIQLELISK